MSEQMQQFIVNILKFTKWILYDVFIKNIKIVAIIFLVIILSISLIKFGTGDACFIDSKDAKGSNIDLSALLNNFSNLYKKYIKVYSMQIVNSNLALVINLSLYLYIVLYASLYFIGTIRIGIYEFIIHITKLIFVAGLLNSSTMNFLNTAILPIVDVLYEKINNSDIFSWLKAVHWDTFAMKIASMLLSPGLGTLYFAGIVMSFYSLLLCSIEVAVLVMTAQLIIYILIALGPLFLICLLFQTTARFFINWRNQIITHLITPIIVMLFMTSIFEVNNFFLGSVLNYTICIKNFISIPLTFLPFNIYLSSIIPWGMNSIYSQSSSENGLSLLGYEFSGASFGVFLDKFPDLICFLFSVVITYYFYNKAKEIGSNITGATLNLIGSNNYTENKFLNIAATNTDVRDSLLRKEDKSKGIKSGLLRRPQSIVNNLKEKANNIKDQTFELKNPTSKILRTGAEILKIKKPLEYTWKGIKITKNFIKERFKSNETDLNVKNLNSLNNNESNLTENNDANILTRNDNMSNLTRNNNASNLTENNDVNTLTRNNNMSNLARNNNASNLFSNNDARKVNRRNTSFEAPKLKDSNNIRRNTSFEASNLNDLSNNANSIESSNIQSNNPIENLTKSNQIKKLNNITKDDDAN